MKKIKTFIITVGALFLLAITVQPETVEATEDSTPQSTVTITVTEQRRYSSFPPNSISGNRTINGISYIGTLYRVSYYQQDGFYFATYRGTLTGYPNLNSVIPEYE